MLLIQKTFATGYQYSVFCQKINNERPRKNSMHKSVYTNLEILLKIGELTSVGTPHENTPARTLDSGKLYHELRNTLHYDTRTLEYAITTLAKCNLISACDYNGKYAVRLTDEGKQLYRRVRKLELGIE